MRYNSFVKEETVAGNRRGLPEYDFRLLSVLWKTMQKRKGMSL